MRSPSRERLAAGPKMPLPRLCSLFRPKRSWLQYRLRTLFVLTMLVAVWLSYNTCRFQREKSIVDAIKARDPKAVVVWSGPAWLRWLGQDSTPSIFHRVEKVAIQVEIKSRKELLDLRLHHLLALKELELAIDRQEDASPDRAVFELFPGIRLTLTEAGASLSEMIEGYLKNPTNAAADRLHKELHGPNSFRTFDGAFKFSIPDEFVHGDALGLDGEEEALADLLTCRHEVLRVDAATGLWVGHSLRHAREALKAIEKPSVGAVSMRQSIALIDAELKPERILAELQKPVGDDTRWWAWLAALRPNPVLFSDLARLAKQEPPLVEAVYALGQSKDPRALSTLLEVWCASADKDSRYSDVCRIAARAIVAMEDPATESRLIELLGRKDCPAKPLACGILGVIGTARSLPELRRLAADEATSNRTGGAVPGAAEANQQRRGGDSHRWYDDDTRVIARRAIKAIEWRMAQKRAEGPRHPPASPEGD
jgi:hypothetical protein